jgi:hypothetical protein
MAEMKATGVLVVMAMDLMSSDVGMGTVLGTVTAKRLGVSLDEFLQGDPHTVRREMDATRECVFGDPDSDPTQELGSG